MKNVTGDLAVSPVVGHWSEAIDYESGVWTDGPTAGADAAGTSDD